MPNSTLEKVPQAEILLMVIMFAWWKNINRLAGVETWIKAWPHLLNLYTEKSKL